MQKGALEGEEEEPLSVSQWRRHRAGGRTRKAVPKAVEGSQLPPAPAEPPAGKERSEDGAEKGMCSPGETRP